MTTNVERQQFECNISHVEKWEMLRVSNAKFNISRPYIGQTDPIFNRSITIIRINQTRGKRTQRTRTQRQKETSVTRRDEHQGSDSEHWSLRHLASKRKTKPGHCGKSEGKSKAVINVQRLSQISLLHIPRVLLQPSPGTKSKRRKKEAKRWEVDLLSSDPEARCSRTTRRYVSTMWEFHLHSSARNARKGRCNFQMRNSGITICPDRLSRAANPKPEEKGRSWIEIYVRPYYSGSRQSGVWHTWDSHSFRHLKLEETTEIYNKITYCLV